MGQNAKLGYVIKALAFAGFLLQTLGCGYQFVTDNPLLPKDARTIFIEPFVNRSRDVGLEKELATAMRSEIATFNMRRIVELIDVSLG